MNRQTKLIPPTICLVLTILTSAQAAAPGSAKLQFSGVAAAETFAPNRPVEMRKLGLLKGFEQFSVNWAMATSTYEKPDYRRFVVEMTALNDGRAIQGMILTFERGKEFAQYEPRCVLNGPDNCDIRAEGIDLDVSAKLIRFSNAQFKLKSAKKDRFPEQVSVSGVLRY